MQRAAQVLGAAKVVAEERVDRREVLGVQVLDPQGGLTVQSPALLEEDLIVGDLLDDDVLEGVHPLGFGSLQGNDRERGEAIQVVGEAAALLMLGVDRLDALHAEDAAEDAGDLERELPLHREPIDALDDRAFDGVRHRVFGKAAWHRDHAAALLDADTTAVAQGEDQLLAEEGMAAGAALYHLGNLGRQLHDAQATARQLRRFIEGERAEHQAASVLGFGDLTEPARDRLLQGPRGQHEQQRLESARRVGKQVPRQGVEPVSVLDEEQAQSRTPRAGPGQAVEQSNDELSDPRRSLGRRQGGKAWRFGKARSLSARRPPSAATSSGASMPLTVIGASL